MSKRQFITPSSAPPKNGPSALSDDIPFATRDDIQPRPPEPTAAEVEAAFWRNYTEVWNESQREEKLALRGNFIRFQAAFRAANKTAKQLKDIGMSNKAEIDRAANEAGKKAGEEAVAKDKKKRANGADHDSNVTPIRSGEKPGFGPIDDRIADVFAEEHRDDLRYVAAWGKWLEWQSGCWREDAKLKVFALIRKTCKQHGIEKARMAKMTADVHSLVRADPRLAATADQWDADPWLLNTPTSMVDLRTGEARKHNPLAYCTKITAAGARGDCPRWLAFLKRVMGDDEPLIAYLKRALGYCLTGDTSEQALFFAHGVGQNGKTVLMTTVADLLGDYCQATPIETFTESKTDRHPTELARMRGARLVTATETEGGRFWAESRLKEITGGERVAARFMHKDFFEYQPQFKPFISGNHKPRLRSVGKAMRRRVNMIPFFVVIPDDERDPNLVAKLKAEWAGILQWMIDGCLDWQEHGLAPPEAVTNATDAYFAGEDGYADWIADRCEQVRGHWARSSQLFASWKDWAEKAGLHASDTKRFREEMERLGFPAKRDKTGVFFVGLVIRQDPPERRWGD
jgi:putative DNA primase/helicase